MASTRRKRSRSETRKFEIPDGMLLVGGRGRAQDEKDTAHATSRQLAGRSSRDAYPFSRQQSMEELSRSSSLASNGQRKTLAELISEAKSQLEANQVATSLGGLRLVNTRRPVTPREPGRVLYGKVALPGRPPSAFSMHYLRNSDGSRAPKTPPTLEPIKCEEVKAMTQQGDQQQEQKLPFEELRSTHRSQSLDLRANFRSELSESNEHNVGDGDCDGDGEGISVRAENGAMPKEKFPRKLPALEVKSTPKVGGKQRTEKLKAQGRAVTFDGELVPATDVSNMEMVTITERKLPMKNLDLLSASSTEKLIELLKEHAGLKECTETTVEHVHGILLELYSRVRKNAKQFKRGFILGGLYGLVECSSAKILLAVARVVLALLVTGSNLTGACKLIFKVARNEQNDSLFHDNDALELLIDGLGRASPLDDPEACIYGYGSIRFLTSSSATERAEASKSANSALKPALKATLSLEERLPPRKLATAPGLSSSASFSNSSMEEECKKQQKQRALVERLTRHGTVELLVLHLQMLNEAGAQEKLQGPPLHSLYQLAASLRALADMRQTLNMAADPGIGMGLHAEELANVTAAAVKPLHMQLELACPHLIRAAEITIGESEVQANIVRTLSLLSEDSNCCQAMANATPRIGMLLAPYSTIPKNLETAEKQLILLNRLGYILGNVMAKHDSARVQFYHNDVAMESLLNVLSCYSQQEMMLANNYGDTVLDVLVKLVRVVANIGISAEVGCGLGNTGALGEILLQLLRQSSEAMRSAQAVILDELAQATLGALHNLCFYQDKSATPAQVIVAQGSLASVLCEMAVALCVTLRSCRTDLLHLDIRTETLRVLGNLTRNAQARISFCEAQGLQLLLEELQKSLHREQNDLQACAVGVLVNLLGDRQNRAHLLQLEGKELLTELLHDALQQDDWFLAAIVCQAFWNLLIDMNAIANLYDEHSFDDVAELLGEYSEEELDMDDLENSDAANAAWQEFLIVASDLYERLQNLNEPIAVEADAAANGGTEAQKANEDDDDHDVFMNKFN